MHSAVVFGSSVTSARYNGATLFFRGLCRALARAGLQTLFAEEWREVAPEADIPSEVAVRRYSTSSDVRRLLEGVRSPRLVLKFVACGSMDAAVEETILSCRQSSDFVMFVDGDAPVTLEQIRISPEHPLRLTLPRFDGVLILAGGEAAVREFLALGVSRVCWGYCAVDEEFWHPVPPVTDFAVDLLFVGNRLVDRDSRVQEFLLRPAALCPDRRFLLAGFGWEEVKLPPNVQWIGHLSPQELRLAYSSARLVLNVNRSPMARYGYSPGSRLFEAAGCGACIVSDRWPGIEELFAPGQEIFLMDGAAGVVSALQEIDLPTRRRIGLAARQRVLRDYTCDRWVKGLLEIVAGWEPEVAGRRGIVEGNGGR